MKVYLLFGCRTIVTAGLLGFLVTAASAQFPIPIPSIPKIKKVKKPDPTPSPTREPETTSDSTNSSTSDTGQTSQPAVKMNCDEVFRGVYGVYSEDIQKTMDDINEFTPDRDYFVRDFNDNQNKYLKDALTPGEAQKWFSHGNPEEKKCMQQRFDELAALAAKKIGTYTPVGYTLGTAADKAILRSAVDDIAKATVFQVGVKNNSWRVVSNSYGIPEGRKKLGKLWLKYPGNKYCTIVWANIWQAYAGGGTYNSSTGDFIAWEFAGCPPGK